MKASRSQSKQVYLVGALILLLAGALLLSFPERARPAALPAIVSDDFNSCELNQELWTLVDPVGDAGLTFNGTQARLSVPAGVNHDVWKAGNRAPRLMQAAPNEDFEIDVKFESGFDAQYQLQGILVEADANNFMRFDFYSNLGTRVFAAKFVDGSPTSFVSKNITGMGTAPLYMRVKRVGDKWTQSYSLDGQSWTVAANGYLHALNVTKVGVFAGNAGGNPAHTAVIDYVFNTAAPIEPEDGRRNALNVTVSGSGTVTPSPDPAGYPCGEVVTLSAAPEPGWVFEGWTGDITSTANPETLKMDGDKSLTATFVPEVATDTTPPVISDIRVTTETTSAVVTWTTDESATSRVDFGPSEAYENGSVEETVLATDHSITLTGLSANTLYHFRVRSVDESGNEAVGTDMVFTTPQDPAPVIDVWHGENQRFGHLGNPQRWVNILGNASDPDGVGSLTYTLNGGAPKTLSIGPNGRRLAAPGDFNIDIDRTDLVEGLNQVAITAVDALGNRSDKTVVVDFAGQPVWPLPYNIDWSSTANIQDAAQVVDGKWAVGAAGLRTTATGYDRLVALGDVSWTDYEVTVPVTIHNVDYAAAGLGGSPALGVLMRWQGHTDDPISDQQPKAGWLPNGNIGWWRFYSSQDVRLEWYDPPASQPFIPALETEYIFKVRVQSTPGSGGLYSLKVWEAAQTEPADWNLTVQEGDSDVAGGSLLLLANYVDATFGNVTVIPVAPD